MPWKECRPLDERLKPIRPGKSVNHVSGPDPAIIGAGSRIRTRDPLITNQVLCQLSYTGHA